MRAALPHTRMEMLHLPRKNPCYTKFQFDRPAHAWPQHIVLLAKPAIKCIR